MNDSDADYDTAVSRWRQRFAQAILFVLLLPVYTFFYALLWNTALGLTYPLGSLTSVSVWKWRHLTFGLPYEQFVAVAGSLVTVYLLTTVAGRWSDRQLPKEAENGQ